MSTGRSGRTCRTCSGVTAAAGLALELAGASAGDRSVLPEAGSLGPGVSCIRAPMASVSTILELSPRLHKGKRRADSELLAGRASKAAYGQAVSHFGRLIASNSRCGP